MFSRRTATLTLPHLFFLMGGSRLYQNHVSQGDGKVDITTSVFRRPTLQPSVTDPHIQDLSTEFVVTGLCEHPLRPPSLPYVNLACVLSERCSR